MTQPNQTCNCPVVLSTQKNTRSDWVMYACEGLDGHSGPHVFDRGNNSDAFTITALTSSKNAQYAIYWTEF